jgi:hypothetical protein
MEKNQAITDWTKVSELEIIYKAKIKAAERPQIRMSSDVYHLFLATWNLDKIELGSNSR